MPCKGASPPTPNNRASASPWPGRRSPAPHRWRSSGRRCPKRWALRASAPSRWRRAPPSASPPRQQQRKGEERRDLPSGDRARSPPSVDNHDSSISRDGDVTTALVGADWRTERWRAGAALSHSWGSGSYEAEGESSGDRDGDSSSTMTGLFPYGRYGIPPASASGPSPGMAGANSPSSPMAPPWPWARWAWMGCSSMGALKGSASPPPIC
ncbi:MAG: autotransporter domain-containing protein [Synechococcus sp. SB0662_bin_45]|uniref:Autotransporter domain-containing protein n=1 Tax=Synechococcus sp. SB0676_bin_10 TaxID=2604869 RepID=A0A6B1F966_9SYNE|nr:autotransporter domain-containing protein [Synechococcus sp. SB0668_bin_13]MXX08741.1 autotransporter domain-containing protein [Synechococcus sp. SB0667_bin_8]MXY19142.1 autotransporter domain-containing protein [Synechococcus sp. SB0664_bin_36]MYE20880.1 autotransporter domain-containing protein [Synechococcus sp. SB0662_bin_45]MYG37764.1 autotransporter domain-containing protein [Synechococcus sp. SB0676_bin_10]MYG63157.1 autotransporter domain-containing protein [Synechococcus sp. SB067